MARKHDPDEVLEAGLMPARIAKVYASALAAAALRQGEEAAVAVGHELDDFVRQVLDADPFVESYLANPTIGKKAKAAALDAALAGRASDLLRGLLHVLNRNARLGLIRQVNAAYRDWLDERAGRVRVKVTSAVALSEEQQAAVANALATTLKKQPVLQLRVDPALIGGLVVQLGDRVVDTSIRTRLNTLRTLLLDKGSSYVLQQA